MTRTLVAATKQERRRRVTCIRLLRAWRRQNCIFCLSWYTLLPPLLPAAPGPSSSCFASDLAPDSMLPRLEGREEGIGFLLPADYRRDGSRKRIPSLLSPPQTNARLSRRRHRRHDGKVRLRSGRSNKQPNSKGDSHRPALSVHYSFFFLQPEAKHKS